MRLHDVALVGGDPRIACRVAERIMAADQALFPGPQIRTDLVGQRRRKSAARTEQASGRTVVTVDVSRRPELARKYGVVLVPTAVAVTSSGAVVERLA